MSHPERGMQIAKNLKVIDWLKTEILDQIANLFKGLHHANQHLILDSLASLVVVSYVLARRVGISLPQLDQAVVSKPREHIREGHQLENWRRFVLAGAAHEQEVKPTDGDRTARVRDGVILCGVFTVLIASLFTPFPL